MRIVMTGVAVVWLAAIGILAALQSSRHPALAHGVAFVAERTSNPSR